MKKICFILALIASLSGYAQKSKDISTQVGKIILSPYVQNDEPISASLRSSLINKLNAILTQNGCAGFGFENRFIVTAHLQKIDESTTATTPTMTVAKVGITIYVGDGVNGTLFSSWYTEEEGVGETKDDAWRSAIKKIPAKSPELIGAMEEGKHKIVEYYNNAGPDIIAKAEAAAKANRFDEAIAELIFIPSACSYYDKAQSLIASYGKTFAENANMSLVSQARAAWSASYDEEGAQKAEQILQGLDNPSASVMTAANNLTKEIATRMKAVSDRQFNFEQQQAKWQHEYEMQVNANDAKVRTAAIKAAAKTAQAYWNSRPRIVYHTRWW